MKTTEAKKDSTIRLPGFLRIVRIAAFLIVLVFLALVLRFPEAFGFIVEQKLFLGLMLVGMFIDPLFSYLVPRLARQKLTYVPYIYNIVWALFIAGLLYTMGGIQSFFVIALVFPIVTTAFDLEARATLVLGVIIEMLFMLLMVMDTRYLHTVGYYTGGILSMVLIALFTYYLYRIIKDGIRQRFEKEDIKRRYFDLTEMDQAKSVFLTVTSHQLQTPISELRWAIQSVLEEKRWNARVEQTLVRSGESIVKLADIVASIIHTAEAGSADVAYKNTPVDIGVMIRSIVQDLKVLAAQNEVAITVQEAEGCVVDGDPDRLWNAFFNVVDNAVRYSPRGNVSLSIIRESWGVKVIVSDTGIGISPQEQSYIFTRFFRAENAIKIDPNETGVGLFIAKNIIERHHGTIRFVSELGKGTTFTVFLPFSPHAMTRNRNV